MFVAIPSYDDPDIVATVHNLLDAAATKVRVGVALQDDNPEIGKALCALGADVHAMGTAQARGCGWARAVAASLWEDEPWYYQCDAHMSFDPGWDAHLIEQHSRMPTPGVLSTHPGDINATSTDRTTVTNISRVTPWGFSAGASDLKVWGDVPIIGRAVSGAHQFMDARVIQAIPLDPYLMFWVEQCAMTLRFWSHGYDIWHPGGPPRVRHKYMHERRLNNDQYWNRDKPRASEQHVRSRGRLHVLAGRQPGDLGAYGLGGQRTVAEWQDFAEVDLKVEGDTIRDPEWRARLANVTRGP